MIQTPERTAQDIKKLTEEARTTRRWIIKTGVATLGAATLAAVSFKVGYSIDHQNSTRLNQEAPVPPPEEIAAAQTGIARYETSARELGRQGQIEELPRQYDSIQVSKDYSIKDMADFRIQREIAINAENKWKQELCKIGVVAGLLGTTVGVMVTMMGAAVLRQMRETRDTLVQRLKAQPE